MHTGFRPAWEQIARALDVIAVIGAWLVVPASVAAVRRLTESSLQLALAFYAGVVIVILNSPLWSHAYDLSRLTGPSLAVIVLVPPQFARWWLLLPIAMIVPRVLLDMAWQIKGVVGGPLPLFVVCQLVRF